MSPVRSPLVVRGAIRVPGDKSMSHRALILAAMTNGSTRIRDILVSADVYATAGALRAMGVHPVDYLAMPRFFAMTISMPLLIAEAVAFGLAASWFVAVLGFGIPSAWFWMHTIDHTNLEDLSYAMTKGLVFGMLIVVISCHQGLSTTNGAVGVGQSTTRAVVFSSLALLVTNFFLTLLLNYIFPMGTIT